MGKFFALMALLRKGSEISEVEKWKQRQITANMVGGLILAIVAALKAFGYELPVEDDVAYSIGGGIVAVVNVVLTAVTSKRAGLPAPAGIDGPTEPAKALPEPVPAAAEVTAPAEVRQGDDPAVGGYLPG